MREALSLLLSGMVIALNCTAIILYVRQIQHGGTIPNPASWVIWAIVAGVNVTSYQAGTHDVVMSMNGYVSTGNCIFMFGYCWWRGQLRELTWTDLLAISIAVLAVITWKLSSTAWYGNAVVQAAVLMSFSLTLWGMWTEKRHEWWVPWCLWTGCHTLTLGIVLLRWKDDPYALLYPSLGITLNTLVTLSAYHKRKLKIVT